MTMTFEELLSVILNGDAGRICTDSRRVGSGDVFVAIKGGQNDGHYHILDSIGRGASYIVCERIGNCKGAKMVLVEDSAKAAAILAQAAAGNPAKDMVNLAITGTNGKTTIAYMVHSIIKNGFGKCGLIGTVECDTGAEVIESEITTPDSLRMAELTRQMRDNGVHYMVAEASSHGIVQKRLWGIDFAAAGFTNLTGDHLDYHKSEENYLAAKGMLFEGLSSQSTAVINKQSRYGSYMADRTQAIVMYYGIDTKADISACVESMDISGSVFTIDICGFRKKVRLNLPGRYNISNALAAAGLCFGAGIAEEKIVAGLCKLENVAGRVERIESGGINVIIDYAHTDDALENVLGTIKPLCEGRLFVVFGCGGDRDKTKRPRMARVAERYGDRVIVTSDNPRSEHPALIIGEIYTGFENPADEKIIAEIDRELAIKLAIEEARKDDIIVIAGKGHENYQEIGDQRRHFSDKEVSLRLLGGLG